MGPIGRGFGQGDRRCGLKRYMGGKLRQIIATALAKTCPRFILGATIWASDHPRGSLEGNF